MKDAENCGDKSRGEQQTDTSRPIHLLKVVPLCIPVARSSCHSDWDVCVEVVKKLVLEVKSFLRNRSQLMVAVLQSLDPISSHFLSLVLQKSIAWCTDPDRM